MPHFHTSGTPLGRMASTGQLDELYNKLYDIAVSKTARKLVALRINPDRWHQARVASVTAKKTLGQWLEEAIAEKVEREKGDRHDS